MRDTLLRADGDRTIFLALTLVAACGGSNDFLRAQAGYDMRCAEQQLQIDEIDERTRRVSGCGQRVTYTETCQNEDGGFVVGTPIPLDKQCDWVISNAEHPRAYALVRTHPSSYGSNSTPCEVEKASTG